MSSLPSSHDSGRRFADAYLDFRSQHPPAADDTPGRRRTILKIWTELPNARLKEQLADVLTAGWVVVWGSLAWQLYVFLAGFVEAGRMIRGGEGIVQAGRDLGEVLGRLPLVGAGVRDVVRNAFAGGGKPLSDVGTSLAQFILPSPRSSGSCSSA